MPKTNSSSSKRRMQRDQVLGMSKLKAARDLLAAQETEAQITEEQEAKALLEANFGTLEHVMNYLDPPLSMSEILELYHPMDEMSEENTIEGIPYKPKITLAELEDILKERSLTAAERDKFHIFMEGLAKDFDEGEEINREREIEFMERLGKDFAEAEKINREREIEQRIKREQREQKRIRSITGEGDKWKVKASDVGSSSSRSRRDLSRDASSRDGSGRKLYKTRNKKSRRGKRTRRARNTRKARR